MSHASISKFGPKPGMEHAPKTNPKREAKASVEIAGLRHQLLTPLNHIIGYAELLMVESPELGYSSLHQNLARIRETARQLVRMIHAHLGANAAPRGAKLAAENVANLRWDFA